MSIITPRIILTSLKRQLIRKNSIRSLNCSTTVFNIGNNIRENNILDSGLADIEIPNISIPEYIYSHVDNYSNLTALECGVTGRKFTYNEFKRKSQNFCRGLRKKLKLNSGDTIAILLPNIPEYPVAVLGSLEAGLIVTTINPIYTAEEIVRQLEDSSAKAIITLSKLWDTAKATENLLNRPLPIITVRTKSSQLLPNGAIDFNELSDVYSDCGEIKPRKPEDVAFLPYSSGTTGLPKGVELTHRNLVANISQLLSPDIKLFQAATETFQDTYPAVLPMFHIYGLGTSCIAALIKGCKQITLPKFTSDDYISVLRQHKPNLLLLVPPMVLFLTSHSDVKKEHLQCLDNIVCGAAPLGALDEERFLEKAQKDITIMQGYGLTESGTVAGTTAALRAVKKNVQGSIGRPIPNTLIKVVDIETDEALGPNQLGELLVKGPQVMKGYHNKPEATAHIFSNDWLRTGDMVYYNEDGVLFVTDRLKELIKVKAFQVAPAELEEVIRDFPDVIDAAVIGIPHPIHGEVPRAYVVPKCKISFDPHKLVSYVAKKVAEYKHITGGVAVVESIPKTPSGKILRRDLKQQYKDEVQKS